MGLSVFPKTWFPSLESCETEDKFIITYCVEEVRTRRVSVTVITQANTLCWDFAMSQFNFYAC